MSTEMRTITKMDKWMSIMVVASILQVSSKVWREVLAKQRTALAASLTGEIR